MRHVQQREGQADDAGALCGDELDALHEVLAQGADRDDLAAARQLQDRVERREQGAEDDVDADGRGERHVLGRVDERRDAARAEALGEQRGEDVVGLVAERRDEHLGALHALVDEQALVHAVAVQDSVSWRNCESSSQSGGSRSMILVWMPSAARRRAMETPSQPPPAMMTLRVRAQRLPSRAMTLRTEGRSATRKTVSPAMRRMSSDGALTISPR